MRIWSKHLAILRYKLRFFTPILKAECYRLLCYGDSNTWGYPPGGGRRFQSSLRWPGILERKLGEEFVVFEDGFNGRTTRWDDPHMPGVNGRRALVPILRHYAPLDLIALVLGTNDLKVHFDQSAVSIAEGIKLLCQDIQRANVGREHDAPEILIVSPPPITHLTSVCRAEFDGAIEKSMLLAQHYSRTALQLKIHFIDAAKYISGSSLDPIHWDSFAHQAFGRIMADKVTNILTG